MEISPNLFVVTKQIFSKFVCYDKKLSPGDSWIAFRTHVLVNRSYTIRGYIKAPVYDSSILYQGTHIISTLSFTVLVQAIHSWSWSSVDIASWLVNFCFFWHTQTWPVEQCILSHPYRAPHVLSNPVSLSLKWLTTPLGTAPMLHSSSYQETTALMASSHLQI